jgi:cell division protein FtsQ
MSLPLARPRPRPRVSRRAAVAALAVLVALAAGWLWLRDSSLVRVQDVFITGLTSSEQNEVRDALRSAALEMTTLNVDEDSLRAAVAPFTSVRDVVAEGDFPHKLTIEVVEHAPVGALKVGRTRVPVAADGRVLHGVEATPELATVRVRRIPADRVRGRRPRASVQVLAAAPEPLRERVSRVRFAGDGLTADLVEGPPLIFGDAADAAVKWAAAARVLADPTAAGAAYLDVRVPGRVAAGGLGPIAEPEVSPAPVPESSEPGADAAATPTPLPTPEASPGAPPD